MNIDRKITVRGMVMDIVKANGWEGEALQRLSKLALIDPSGMAQVWIKGRRNKSYFQRHILMMNKRRAYLNRCKQYGIKP